MDLHRAGRACRDAALCLHRRGSREAVVELAAAAALRLAPGDVLAGARVAGALPHSLRRPRFLGHQVAAQSRGARADPSAPAGTIPLAASAAGRLHAARRREPRAVVTAPYSVWSTPDGF